jgi:hypothetical protein
MTRKTPFIALKVHSETADRVRQLAEKQGLTISACLEDLVQRAQGLETQYGTTLPPRRAVHRESYDAGRAEGAGEIVADALLINEIKRDRGLFLLKRMGVDIRDLAEWDLRVIREYEGRNDIPAGVLVRNHKRGPKV